jgi:heme-degrading monooxygenase HmoA
MVSLACKQDGYLGHESVRGGDGFGITVSYWRDERSIQTWKSNAHHKIAQKLGNERWYDALCVRIAKVEQSYGGPNS